MADRDAVAQSVEGQLTLTRIAEFEAAIGNLDTIIAAANAAPVNGWDSATAQQRTQTIKNLALAVRGLAYILKGVKVPLGDARVPD